MVEPKEGRKEGRKFGSNSVKTFAVAGDQGHVSRLINMIVLSIGYEKATHVYQFIVNFPVRKASQIDRPFLLKTNSLFFVAHRDRFPLRPLYGESAHADPSLKPKRRPPVPRLQAEAYDVDTPGHARGTKIKIQAPLDLNPGVAAISHSG